ncbi:hypothetical protein GCM10025865_03310 [Paraoerskovia sediminicola]|uniref:Uncharacterized protein n=1 Tax=Paraoerskovia sediminicola TaxID=1138587 RepID=A0ABM8FZ50_9CELL|nr:hypothetical protein GCM10025865_03310 [Paraoerskovia sediminicola]
MPRGRAHLPAPHRPHRPRGQQGHRRHLRGLGRHPRWGLIDKALELGIPEPKETYSTSPHLYTELHIPEGTKGRLPRDKRTHAGLEAEVLEDLGETGKHAGSTTQSRSEGQRGQRGGPRGQGGRDGGRSGGGRRGDSGRSGGGRPSAGASGSGERQGAPGADRTNGTDSSAGGSDGAPRRRNRRRTRGGRPATGGTATGGSPTGATE